MLVGDDFLGDATPLASLQHAATRLCSMLPQFLHQHVSSDDARRADLVVELFQTSDDAPLFRVVFHTLGAPVSPGRWDVVLCNWTDESQPPKVVHLGPDSAEDTDEHAS